MRAPLVCLAVAALVAAGAARADARSVGVVVTGEEMLQTPLRAQLEIWLRGHGHEPVASPLPPDAINKLGDCFVMEDQACAQKLVEQNAKSDAVLYARVEAVASGKSRDVTLEMHFFVRGAPVANLRRVCEGCSDDAMHAAAEEMVAKLVPAEAPTVKPPPPTNLVVVHQQVRRSRTIPALVTGTGAAALIAGAVLYLTSETDDGSKLYYRDTKPLGIGLGIGGAVLVGAGIILLLRDSPGETGPAVAVAPHGGFVGWTGAF